MALDLTIGNVANQIGIKPPTPVAPVPVGQKATAPAPVTPTNTLPKSQVAAPAQQDFSSKYGLNNGTVYDKATGKGFSSDAEFKAATGYSSNGQKFDTTYTPPTTPAPQTAPVVPNPAPVTSPTPTPTPNPISTTPAPTGPYTPPNQGTTGVSQGGIIGNLIGIANNESPQVTQARQDLQGLQNNYASQTANIKGSPIDLSLANGQQGILNQLFAAKQGAAQTALSSALTSQGQGIQANQAAGGLNAPIQAGAYISPSGASTTGQTTSGATSLSSLIGQRPSSSNPGVTEYYNTQTGQGFSSPQQLADFVNQQQPGANANASNVFDLLKSGSLNNPNGGGGTLNPLNNISKLVSDVISDKMSYNDALGQGGNVANFAGALKAAISQADPNFDFINSQASAAAKAANIQSAGTASTDAARQTYIQSYPAVQSLNQAINNVTTAGQLTFTNAQGKTINPLTLAPANGIVNDIRSALSSQDVNVFNSNLTNLGAMIRNLYSTNGGSTPSGIESNIDAMLNGTLQLDTLKAMVATAEQEGQGRLANAVNTASSAYNQTQQNAGGTGSSVTNGTTAGGGSLIYQNGQWVVQ